jgi:hypothetical protein
MTYNRIALFSGLFLLLTLSGCWYNGLRGLAQVNGVVVMDGAPLAGATVTMIPQTLDPKSARAAAGKSDSDGKFKLTTLKPNDGVFPGEYTITVIKFVSEEVLPASEIRALMAQGKKYNPKVEQVVPKKYTTQETSGLTFTVQKGKNPDLVIEIISEKAKK